MKITADYLKTLDACADQRKLFKETFPEGAEITRDNLDKARAAGLAVAWLAEKVCPDYAAKRAPLWADYGAKRVALWADYAAKCAPLLADYEAKHAPLLADYEAKEAALAAECLLAWSETDEENGAIG